MPDETSSSCVLRNLETISWSHRNMCAFLCHIECCVFACRCSTQTNVKERKKEESFCSFFSSSLYSRSSFHSPSVFLWLACAFSISLVSSDRFVSACLSVLLLFSLTTTSVLVAVCSAIDDDEDKNETQFLASFLNALVIYFRFYSSTLEFTVSINTSSLDYFICSSLIFETRPLSFQTENDQKHKSLFCPCCYSLIEFVFDREQTMLLRREKKRLFSWLFLLVSLLRSSSLDISLTSRLHALH